MTNHLSFPHEVYFLGNLQLSRCFPKFQLKCSMSPCAWSFSLRSCTLMMKRSKSLFLESSTNNIASDEEELDEGETNDDLTFISHVQQWIDKACELLILTCQIFLKNNDECFHNQSNLSNLVKFRRFEKLVRETDKLLVWSHWLYDFTYKLFSIMLV